MEIKNLGQLLQHLATKAGIKADDPNLISLLSNADINKVSVNSEFVGALDSSLLHIESALDQHPQIRNKYTAEVLNPFDSRLAAIIEELGLDDAGRTELAGIKSTYKRFDAVTSKLKELKDAKAAATNGADKQALQQQIDQLQASLRQAKANETKIKEEYDQKLNSDKLSFRLLNKFSGVKTILDHLPQDARNSILKELIDKELQAKNAELRFDDKGDVSPFTKDGSKLYGANHIVTTLDSLIDSVLAQNKLIQVSQASTQPSGNGNQQQTPTAQVIDAGGNTGQTKITGTNQAVLNANLEALKAFESDTQAA